MKSLSFVTQEIIKTIQENKGTAFRAAITQLENAVIEEALIQCRGNQTKVSELLGISRATLRKRMGLTGAAK